MFLQHRRRGRHLRSNRSPRSEGTCSSMCALSSACSLVALCSFLDAFSVCHRYGYLWLGTRQSRPRQARGVGASMVVNLHIRLQPVSGAIGRRTWLARFSFAASTGQMVVPKSQRDSRGRVGSVAHASRPSDWRTLLLPHSPWNALIYGEYGGSQHSDDGAFCTHTRERSACDCDALECY